MGDQPGETSGAAGADGGAEPHDAAQALEAAAQRQDPLKVAADGATAVPFELVVFTRVDQDEVDVSVYGMWSGEAPVLESYSSDTTAAVTVLGVDAGIDARPYRVVVRVHVPDTGVIEVRGVRRTERVDLADLGDHAVVCGADPSMAALDGEFLHRRGGELVPVAPRGLRHQGPARRSSITLVA